MLERPSGSSWLTRTSAMQPTVPGLGHLARPARRRDPEAPVAGQTVGQHLPVARLEDVQRKRRAGEEDDGEGKDGKPEGHGRNLAERADGGAMTESSASGVEATEETVARRWRDRSSRPSLAHC